MVVVLYGGEQPKGRKLVVVSASEEAGRFRIRYRKADASPEEIANAASRRQPWRPVHIAVVPRSKLPPSHEELQ